MTDRSSAALAFARELFSDWPRSLDCDDVRVVEAAERHGLLHALTPTAPCGQDCLCAALFDPEEFAAGVVRCLQKTEGLK